MILFTVAKSYMETVDRNIYFEDVKLQCDAKLWGEEYNRHNPPKKVDIFMMAVLEMVERPGRDLYHVEHYIDRYNALTQTWSTEDVVVKMDSESFAEGAMRECYRM